MQGSYYVLLPDGRKQTVDYKVDGEYGGYIAKVRYEDLQQRYPAHLHVLGHQANQAGRIGGLGNLVATEHSPRLAHARKLIENQREVFDGWKV